ncbi:MAG: hypothetical protein KDD53_03175 [Bdellovibrionales bacterium]|nr:hypothetical protein [Bdellovibrionales bacterium]
MSCFILGAGSAYPDTVISNELLRELNSNMASEFSSKDSPIQARRSCLSLKYLKETKNNDPRNAIAGSEIGSADLGARACSAALEAAKVDPVQIGLVLASCPTPPEMCPSEAQRICRRLGIKTQAFDVSSAGTDFALQLDFLNKMQDEHFPEYVLCVATNTMTQVVNYSDPISGYLFGDCASAIVVSRRKMGGFKILKSEFKVETSSNHLGSILPFGHLDRKHEMFESLAFERVSEQIAKFSLEDGDQVAAYFIPPVAGAFFGERLAKSQRISQERFWTLQRDFGDTGGANSMAVLSSKWNVVSEGERVFMPMVGFGFSLGSVALERVSETQ